MTPQQIAQNRERWIREWTQVVVQNQTAQGVMARR
jgi:thiamine transport system substrate-binding protein